METMFLFEQVASAIGNSSGSCFWGYFVGFSSSRGKAFIISIPIPGTAHLKIASPSNQIHTNQSTPFHRTNQTLLYLFLATAKLCVSRFDKERTNRQKCLFVTLDLLTHTSKSSPKRRPLNKAQNDQQSFKNIFCYPPKNTTLCPS